MALSHKILWDVQLKSWGLKSWLNKMGCLIVTSACFTAIHYSLLCNKEDEFRLLEQSFWNTGK